MLDIDIAKLEETVAVTKALLKEGLLATDIWDTTTGLSLAAHNPQPEATAMFNMLTLEMHKTLTESGFPGLGGYYILELQEHNMAVVQMHGDTLMSGMLLNSGVVNLGVLVSVAIPKYAKGVAAAFNDNK
ncbi:hypothetical protein [Luteipulveratus mongoliensis]|uniref:hypothetical protein n=1 Tax=Luteipulveratus mongoliensis TaxID=571913 RepID=UPI000696B78D|nr:hypothetical protein [Luteipulveratus mongoliensis]